MIQNDSEKDWMEPLANFRDDFLNTDDFDKRDFRRMDGRLTLMDDKDTGGKKLVHGPYLQSYREKMLTALLLAQGAGRLIRSIDDRGVVAIMDSRIVTKRYGSVLLNSMPPLWRTNDKQVVRDSLSRLAKSMEE